MRFICNITVRSTTTLPGGDEECAVLHEVSALLFSVQRVFKSLSNYELMDLAVDNRTRCFRHLQVGLTCHAEFSIDPLRVAPFVKLANTCNAKLANTCNAMLGVRGAGLTNMVFPCTRGSNAPPHYPT
ncbi:unnamed protein product [Triticum turgidum subsp. durum]|uniref:Uncharacterized protein n=1 Tax=Triticum turgidum subsp. durum TaxID=4567 RepID=A0A9R1RKC0_TRITD|nr:unnamed protein product [Triticum turgidum subsp. durum]